MTTSYSWIKRYVPDLDVTPQEYADAMTLSGTKVEGYKILDADLDKIVVGQIKEIEKHPDADKLVVCQVDIGGETIQIVTGAPNVYTGAKVPVVLDGGKVAQGHGKEKTQGGIVIKAGALRGVPSAGMMCSIDELGSSREFYPEAPEDGIYIFPEDTKVGADAVKELGLDDVVFEHEITSNRVDCYSVIGIAREAAATFKKEFLPPKVSIKANAEQASQYVSVQVDDEKLCPRYCARVVKNIKIGPSPKWMQRALASSGIRPINNLVDITNFVMEEYGQPMHAFDLDSVAGHKIIVRRANDGESFVTLDGKEHTLDNDMLMICDAEKAIGIAGIMGGQNSMITEKVKNVLFEAACFDGTNIRLSAKRLGMRTDASSKFEKGLDPNCAKEAADRACQLIEELGCGEVIDGYVDVYPNERKPVRVTFEPEKINKLLGTNIEAGEMLKYLEAVELKYDKETNEIIAPTFRQDIKCTADIAEEVARFYGYDNIPVTLPKGEGTAGKLPFYLRVQNRATELVKYSGFSQAMCYSFESPKVFDKLMLPEDAPERQAIEISNPLGEDFSIMRTTPLNGILTSLATNFNRRNREVRLYEIGNIYIPKNLPLSELPKESKMLTLGMYGSGDFFDLKGVVEEIFENVGMDTEAEYEPEPKRPYFHPGRQANIVYKGERLGYIGEVHPMTANAYGIDARCYIAVIDLTELVKYASFDRKYKEIPKYPAVNRDISIVVPKELPAAVIDKMIRQRGGKILESVGLFDLYEGAQIGEGFKSMAYSIVFRSAEKTLTEQDISAAMKKILNGLESLGIKLRE